MGRRPCSGSLQCGHPGAEKLPLGSSRCKSLSPYKASPQTSLLTIPPPSLSEPMYESKNTVI